MKKGDRLKPKKKRKYRRESKECPYCGNSGMVGSPYELGHYPCTDCDIWWNKIKN